MNSKVTGTWYKEKAEQIQNVRREMYLMNRNAFLNLSFIDRIDFEFHQDKHKAAFFSNMIDIMCSDYEVIGFTGEGKKRNVILEYKARS